jgi:hypothetical protein
MSTLALGLVVILGIATATFYIAGDLAVHGSAWARDVCFMSQSLCDRPGWAAAATAAMAVVYFVLRAARL